MPWVKLALAELPGMPMGDVETKDVNEVQGGKLTPA